MNTGGCHSNQYVTLTHAVRAEQLVSLNQTGCRARNVVLVFCEQAGVLSGFAANQGGASLCTCASDTAHNVSDTLGNDLAGGNVVGHEQRLSAADHDVVHDHADQVVADGVVNIECLRNSDLGAHTVGGGSQVGLAVLDELGDIVQAREAAHATNDGGVVGRLDSALHQLNGAIASLYVNTCARVGYGGGVLAH
ncbi:Uncharacterised protein [Mycobacterium tuberculosis]|nr:Uncharacterised protein [Mycobacterium tuberculosis]